MPATPGSHARADHVLPLDADNLLRPGYVHAALEVLDADDTVAAVHADVRQFGLEHALIPAPHPSVSDLLSGNKLDTCAVLRLRAVEAVDGWDEHVPASEDWAMWVALIDAGWSLSTVRVLGSDYRVRNGSMRSTLSAQVRHDHLVHLLGKHPQLYAAHAVDVIANFSGALTNLEARGDIFVGATGGERALVDRLAEADEAVRQREAEAGTARQRAAEAERDRRDAEHRASELARRLSAAEEEIERLRRHAAEVEATKLVRYTRAPRRLYARLRNGGRP